MTTTADGRHSDNTETNKADIDRAEAESATTENLSVLAYLKHYLAGTLRPQHRTHMRYPTAISQTLGFRLTGIGDGTSELRVGVTPERFGNQGKIYGGFLTELADAAIGTA